MTLTIEELGKVWPINTKPVILHNRKHLGGKYSDYYYPGKNGDIYFYKDGFVAFDLERSNRCSVFGIPLNLEIKRKGEIQTSISDLGFNFAEKFGIKTSRLKKESLIGIQSHELCKPLEAEINGEIVQFEFIFRNYLTGSLKKQYDRNEDLYGLNLPCGMDEWCKMPFGTKFTPTTKGIKDKPLNSNQIRDLFPDIVSTLEDLFHAFTDHCKERGIIIVDTKFEVFINSEGYWVLGDEVFTTESSRFILKENFDNGIYKSMDVLQDWGTKMSWKDKYKFCIKEGYLKQGDKLSVFFIPQSIKDDVIAGYQQVYDMLK